MPFPLALALSLGMAPVPAPIFWSGALWGEVAAAGQLAQGASGGGGGGGREASRRFPLRREGGGTRGACAARLVAQLVPPDGEFDPGPGGILAVIEGEAARPMAPLVLRWGAAEWMAPARAGASLRLLRLAGPAPQGEWFSFPACEGSAEPVAPPPSSQLRPSPTGSSPAAIAARAADSASRAALATLWRACGSRVARDPLLAAWGFSDLADQLPASLPVICAEAPATAPRSPLPVDGR